jgi:hypothetical protein
MKKLVFLFAMIFAVSMAMGQNNDADITQTGDKNMGDIEQIGSSMEATITQVAGASATWGYFNEAYIEQVGQDHTATVDQDGPTGAQFDFGNYAEIAQSGMNQMANVIQVGRNKHTMNQNVTKGAYITQAGADNQATIEQRGTGNNAVVDQDGTGNIGSHIIVADHRTGGTNGTIDQTGTTNTTYQRLETDGNGGELRNSSFYSLQDGSSNIVNQTIKFEWGANNSVSAIQYGEGNNATQLQHSYNMSGNSASVIQGTVSEDALDNIATQEIFGSHNTLSIEQYGDLNVASQRALTSVNSSTIVQTGNMNEAVTLQQ